MPSAADVVPGTTSNSLPHSPHAGLPSQGGPGRDCPTAEGEGVSLRTRGPWHDDPVTEQDRSFVARVLDRQPGPMVGVAVRCRFGRPQVVANFPQASDGTPMPTLFWLVCPLLLQEVSRLEAQGWIHALGQEVATNPEAAAAEAEADRVYAALRRRLLPVAERRRLRTEAPRVWRRLAFSGIAGRSEPGVKCLHAHLASYLALGRGYVGRRVAELLAQQAVPVAGSRTCGCVYEDEASEAKTAGPQTRAAVVELGSHSVRALVADRTPSGLEIVEEHLQVTRLGEGLQDGRLQGPPLEGTLQAAGRMAQRARRVGAGSLVVIGTNAVREAANREELARRVQEATGAALQVLTGDDEARYTFQGACAGLNLAGPAVVVDLGGGSLELAEGTGAGPSRQASVPWGALRLSLRFGTGKDPARVADLLAWLNEQAPKVLASWRGAAREVPWVGVGGTATTLAAMDQRLCPYRPGRVHGYRLTREALEGWVARLAALHPRELLRLPGLQPERAPVILAGAAVLTFVTQWVGATQLRVSEWDVMAGVLAGL